MFKNLSPGAIGYGKPFFEALAPARAAGFEGIDVDARQLLDPAFRDKVVEALERADMVLGGWGLPAPFFDEQAAYEEALERLLPVTAAAASIAYTRAATWIPSWSDERPYAENAAFLMKRVRPAAEILADNGCWLGLEFLGPKTSRAGHKYEFIHTMEQMLELCDAVGTGNVGLLLDAWHWYTSGGTVEQLETLRDEQVVYVHINDAPAGIPIEEQVDNVRRLPGETGVIDLVGFLRALEKIGYTGPVAPEPFSKELQALPEEERLTTAGAALLKVWQAAF